MKNFKKVIATFLSALMVTGSMMCGASAVSTNQENIGVQGVQTR